MYVVRNGRAEHSTESATQKLKRECSAPAELDSEVFSNKWRESGYCFGTWNPEAFFKFSDFSVSEVMCSFCPVMANCLIHALVYEEEGYWGGTNDSERKLFLKENPQFVEELRDRARYLGKYHPWKDIPEFESPGGSITNAA